MYIQFLESFVTNNLTYLCVIKSSSIFSCFPQLLPFFFGFSFTSFVPLDVDLFLLNPMGYVGLYFLIAASRSPISWATFS